MLRYLGCSMNQGLCRFVQLPLRRIVLYGAGQKCRERRGAGCL